MVKKTVLSIGALALACGIGIYVGIAYASVPYKFNPGGEVWFWGMGDPNNILIDVNGSVDGNGDPTFVEEEVIYYGNRTKAGFFSGWGTMIDPANHVWEDRGEIAIGIMPNDGTNAWMQSSGNAKIMAQEDGDIIFTLGD